MAMISSLPIIIRKLSAIFVAGSVSIVITFAERPPVVMTPEASKNASAKSASDTSLRCKAVIAEIKGNEIKMHSGK